MVKGKDAGHFFCATIGERVYLRFVPLDETRQIVSEIGTCLRLIECTEEMHAFVSDEMAEAGYGAWKRARNHVYDAWMFETDPANLQPKVRKLNREVAAFLRDNPPGDVEQDRLERCLDAVEAPWSRREENQLRSAWLREFPSRRAKATALLEEIERIGAEPFHAPDPLPPIEQDEVQLICWLAIQAEEAVAD